MLRRTHLISRLAEGCYPELLARALWKVDSGSDLLICILWIDVQPCVHLHALCKLQGRGVQHKLEGFSRANSGVFGCSAHQSDVNAYIPNVDQNLRCREASNGHGQQRRLSIAPQQQSCLSSWRSSAIVPDLQADSRLARLAAGCSWMEDKAENVRGILDAMSLNRRDLFLVSWFDLGAAPAAACSTAATGCGDASASASAALRSKKPVGDACNCDCILCADLSRLDRGAWWTDCLAIRMGAEVLQGKPQTPHAPRCRVCTCRCAAMRSTLSYRRLEPNPVFTGAVLWQHTIHSRLDAAAGELP